MEKSILLLSGILCLLIGLGLQFWIGKRRFNRKNIIGLEGFSSYEKMLFVRFIERIGKIISYVVILLGILFLWVYSQQ